MSNTAGPSALALSPDQFHNPDLTATGKRRAVVVPTSFHILWFNSGTLCNLECQHWYMEWRPRNGRLGYISEKGDATFLDEFEPESIGVRQIGFTGDETFPAVRDAGRRHRPVVRPARHRARPGRHGWKGLGGHLEVDRPDQRRGMMVAAVEHGPGLVLGQFEVAPAKAKRTPAVGGLSSGLYMAGRIITADAMGAVACRLPPTPRSRPQSPPAGAERTIGLKRDRRDLRDCTDTRWRPNSLSDRKTEPRKCSCNT